MSTEKPVAFQRFHRGEWRECSKEFYLGCMSMREAEAGSAMPIYEVRALYDRPTLAPEDVRRIAEKWNRKRTDKSLRPVDAFIGALNEALGVA